MKKHLKQWTAMVLALVLALSLAACGQGGSGKSADLPQTLETMKNEVGFTDVMDLDENGLQINYGIQADDMKQFAALVDTSGIKCEEVILVEAVDSNAAQRVKEQLDKRMESKLAQNKDYLPEQYAIIQKCSEEQDGNYVSMIVGQEHQKLTEIYQKAFS